MARRARGHPAQDRPFDTRPDEQMTSRLVPISACLIARDEERDLPEALASLDFVEEIVVVVDRRSSDRTAEVARTAGGCDQTVRVIEEEWHGHVAQKNLAVAGASRDWVLCLDADERISPELRQSIVERFEGREPSVSGYACARRTFYLGRWMLGGGWYPDRKVRLFRRSRGRWGGTDPHDRVEVNGRVAELPGDILHFSYRDIRDHVEKIDAHTRIAARELWRRGVRWPVARMCIHPPAKFVKMYLLQRGYRDRLPGLIVAWLGAFYVFLKYARLWEIRRAERDARSHGATRETLLD